MTAKHLNEIIALLQAGDERGEKLFWYKLVMPYKQVCIAYIQRKFPDCPIPEDVVMDAFLRLRIKLLNGKKASILPNMQGFLVVMCKNEWLGKIRRKKREGITSVAEVHGSQKPDVMTEEDLEELKQRKEAAFGIAFAKLGGECQKLIKWHRVEGRKKTDIARLLGENYDTIKTRESRCFKRLRSWAKLSFAKGR
ncbi:MAG: RNA polymerase sigma factor [Chitinophagales bacterium]